MAETKHTHVLDRHPSATYLVADSNVSDAVGEVVSIGVILTEAVVLRVPVGVTAAELLCVGVTAAVTLDVAVTVPVGVWLGVSMRVFVSVTDAEPDADSNVALGVRVIDLLRVSVEVDVLVCVKVLRGVGEKRKEKGNKDMSASKTQTCSSAHLPTYPVADRNVPEAVGDLVFVGVTVGVPVPVTDPVAVVLDVIVSNPKGVWLGVRVREPVSEIVGDAVCVSVCVSVMVSVVVPVRLADAVLV
jgi:hypothetical protein